MVVESATVSPAVPAVTTDENLTALENVAAPLNVAAPVTLNVELNVAA